MIIKLIVIQVPFATRGTMFGVIKKDEVPKNVPVTGNISQGRRGAFSNEKCKLGT